jgi:hypothetical protein
MCLLLILEGPADVRKVLTAAGGCSSLRLLSHGKATVIHGLEGDKKAICYENNQYK